MKKFLTETAETLWKQYGDGISDLHIIFPGKRARLFFNEALLSIVGGRPLWQPRYLSMDDLVRSLTPLETGDRLRLVAELYKICNRYHPEPFDRFFRWGEMLLADFDTLDKYLIDAGALYANISDLRDIEDRFGGLFAGNDEAMALVRGFWTALDRRGVQSVEQQQFLKIWRSLFRIYTEYKARLRELGIGYSGMIYRDVAESLDPAAPERDGRFDGRTFCFVGFNALNACEQRLFAYLKETGAGRFYWDYDNYFYRSEEQEAGRFIRRNVARFGDDAPAGAFDRDNFLKTKEIEAVATPSDVLQCKALYRELEEIYARQGFVDKETAIVLTDESLLLPVLHSIPPVVGQLNVTMGYPLSDTVPYILLERLLQLQSHVREGCFAQADVAGILAHPYVAERASSAARTVAERIETWQTVWVPPDYFAENDLLRSIFRPVARVEQMQEYIETVFSGLGAVASDSEEARERKEFIFTLLDHVIRLGNTIRACDIGLPMGIYIALLRQSLAGCRVPYEGEPLSGLQIMGILETRNLDFDNVILLSLTDDTFPGNREGSSYVPFNLRQAFGLPTPQDHEAMYAYYFYRLIARCRRLTMMYSSAADDRRTGEQSRYIYQLEYESPHRVERANVNLRIDYRPVEPIRIEKSPDILRRLENLEFYPSKLNRYIDCPLKFYFADVERLEAPERTDGEITHLDVGNTLHRAMELLYGPLVGLPEAAARIAELTPERLTGAVERAMVDMLGDRGRQIELSGRMLLLRNVVRRYVEQIVRYDAQQGGLFVVEGLERKVKHRFVLGDRRVVLAGVADRIDRLGDGALRIVDYKSGGDKMDFSSVEGLFSNEKVTRDGELTYEAHNGAVLQTLLYGLVFGEAERAVVAPALYAARKMGAPDFSPFPVSRGEEGCVEWLDPELQTALLSKLSILFDSMFDPSVPFSQTKYDQSCAFCNFRTICRK